jgi:hypothetical protein
MNFRRSRRWGFHGEPEKEQFCLSCVYDPVSSVACLLLPHTKGRYGSISAHRDRQKTAISCQSLQGDLGEKQAVARCSGLLKVTRPPHLTIAASATG